VRNGVLADAPPVRLGRTGALPWSPPLHIAWILGYLALTYWFAHGSLYLQGLVLVAAVFGILAISLDLVAGVTGLYSLGHAGLFALGAYTTTLLYTDHHWSLWVLLPVCIAEVGLVGLVLGSLSLRVSGLYFAITTFVFTLVVTVVASDFGFTGGYNGLVGPIFPAFSNGLSFLGQSLTWCCMVGLLVAMLLALGLRKSPFYPILLAVRDAEPFAAAAGARTSLVKISMFGLSAAMAGAAGWIFSFQGIVSPGQFNWSVSVNILVMVILGGMNTTLGPVLGAVFITVFPAQVNINPFWQEVLFGGLFVLVITLYPAGFVGLARATAAYLLRAVVWREVERPGRASRARAQAAAAEPAPVEIAAVEAAVREGLEYPEPVPLLDPGARNSGVPAVECCDIVFSYIKGIRVLDGVDFLVKKGTIHGLIGPNGSGKSTLVDLIAGRQRPASGTITLDGRRLERGGPAARAHHGFMRTFQAALLVRELSVCENVGIGLYCRFPRIPLRAPVWPVLPTNRRDGRMIRAKAHDALAFVGAAEWADMRVGDVPHGVEQLTQLAAACVAGPSTIILDEPLAGLSPAEVEHVATILSELKGAGVSVILIEHQPRFVFALCDEVTVLDAGKVVATGTAADVRANARVREVYLGQ
jgi:branched-chain amino acid transport system permease protein